MEITKAQATEFMRDLRGTVYGDLNKANGGIMGAGLVADHMRISIEKANQFLNACVKYGVTERQGGHMLSKRKGVQMKTFKAKLILTVITLTILLLATGTRAEAKSRKELGKITRVHGNEITCVDDRTGNAWEFYGTGYHVGDRCRITFKGKRVVDCVTDRQLVKEYCKKHYPKRKIKFVKENDRRLMKRKSKRFVYVERIVSRSKGRYGLTADGGYIRYNIKVKQGKRVVSYAIWNPRNNIEDDVVAVIDNGFIR